MFALTSLFLTAQNNKEYYLEIKPEYNLGTIQQTTNNDGTISITTNIIDFSNFINTKEVYSFKKAFPTALTPRLQRVYTITLNEIENITGFLNRIEIENFASIEKNIITEDFLLLNFPNDYVDALTGVNNTSLDLIKAPLAWTITTGDPDVLVGVSDTKYDFNHYDLTGQILDNIQIANNNITHGTGVAGIISAKTNNGQGVSSLAYNTKLIVATCSTNANNLINGLLQLSQYPGVRVINCSWLICQNNPSKPYLDEVMAEVNSNGVLVVASAGNGIGGTSCGTNGNGYGYPASYDETISVTSVGDRFPIGYFHDLHDPTTGAHYWWRSWKDCYAGQPDNYLGGHTRNSKVDVTAPGQLIIQITDDYNTYPEGYRLGIGTSASAPFVSALAALIFSVNPNLTPAQVKNIIKNTADDIYQIPYNQPYIGQLGTGRINAFRAVKTAQCMLNPTPGLDLAMQNSDLDSFVEPDVETDIVWNSEDIWVRNQNDGSWIDTHQNPVYNSVSPNYVYVRVTNNSCETSSGTDDLKLYWAKASTSLYWPDHWNGTLYMPDPTNPNPVLMGDEIGTLDIPVLGPGESKILEFQWAVPNPQDYVGINPNPWHFCLLARIDTPNDPMTFPEGMIITENVKNNNNLAWKNTTVIEMVPNTTSQIGGVIAVGNPYSSTKTFNLQFIKGSNEIGPAIYEEAEVSVEMDDVFYDAWVRGGMQGQNLTTTSMVSKKRIATGNNMTLSNILFDPNEIGTAYVKFNFLTAQLTAKKDFVYHAIQRDALTNEILGGETYEIHKLPRPVFDADAGNDETIDRSESVTISAAQINEAAVYNWYDPEGNLIYTGTELTVSPDVTKTYKLEIITDTDGYKDYDEVEVTVNPYKLESLVPNPATSQVSVNYIADEASSAYLMVVSTVTGISNNYILDVNETSINLNVSGYSSGIYSVALVCDGEIVDSKNLAKQ